MHSIYHNLKKLLIIIYLFNFNNLFAQESLSLKISTIPFGADVYINSFNKGKTPIFIDMPLDSTITLKIEKKYYEVFEKQIRVDSLFKNNEFNYTLEKQTGFIDINYFPDDADVYINKKKF